MPTKSTADNLPKSTSCNLIGYNSSNNNNNNNNNSRGSSGDSGSSSTGGVNGADVSLNCDSNTSLNLDSFTPSFNTNMSNLIMNTNTYNPPKTNESYLQSSASPIIQQPQLVSNQLLTSSEAPSKISSLSYVDDNNLKMAIVDYTDLLKLIKLQSSINLPEWLAFNTKMYFDQINVLYGAIADYCTPQTCPTMSAPHNSQFFWLDEKGKKCKYSASQYIDTVLTYTAKTTSDEALFPTNLGQPFPANFEALVKKIHKHLFQILAHMYHGHYKELLHLKLNTHVNSIYFHLLMFDRSFGILDEKDIEIMDSLNRSLLNKYSAQHQSAHQPTIHQPTAASNSSSSSSSTSSSSGGGFSFFKKKLNFNLMA